MKEKTEQGYEYIKLKDDTPIELLERYMTFVKLQDELMAAGKLIIL